MIKILILATVFVLLASMASEAHTDESAQIRELIDKKQDSIKLMEKMYENCQLVFIGEYKSFETLKESSNSNTSVVSYRYKDVLKGPWLGSIPRVLYKLPISGSDDSTRINFKDTLLPKKNSKWIIFVQKIEPIDGPWQTYAVSKGIIEHTFENEELFKLAIANYKKRHSRTGSLKLLDGSLYDFSVPIESRYQVSLLNKDPQFKKDFSRFKKMYQESEAIVIAIFESYKSEGKVESGDPPIAVFRRIEYLKGKPLANDQNLQVRYEIGKLEEASSDVSESDVFKLPKKGSKWFLYIPNTKPTNGVYNTLRGAKGRIPYNGWTVELILRYVEMQKGCPGHNG